MSCHQYNIIPRDLKDSMEWQIRSMRACIYCQKLLTNCQCKSLPIGAREFNLEEYYAESQKMLKEMNEEFVRNNPAMFKPLPIGEKV